MRSANGEIIHLLFKPCICICSHLHAIYFDDVIMQNAATSTKNLCEQQHNCGANAMDVHDRKHMTCAEHLENSYKISMSTETLKKCASVASIKIATRNQLHKSVYQFPMQTCIKFSFSVFFQQTFDS